MASSTYEVAFRLGATTASSFTNVMKGAQGALGEVNKRMAELGKQQAAGKRVIELRQGLQTANREFHAARQRVEQLGAQMGKTAKPTKAMVAEYKRAQTEVSKASANLDKQRESLRKVETDAGLTGRSIASLTADQERLAKASERAAAAQNALQRNVAAQEKNLQQRAKYRGQMMDAVALGASLAVPVKQAMEWEQTLAEFNKVAGKTPEEVKAISEAAQEMAVQTGVAREGIMGAFIAAAQAGFDESEWQQYAEAAAKMGVAFDISGEEAGEMLKAWRSSMGLSMDDAEKLAAAANHIANSMNAVAGDVGQVLQRQGALMRTAGLTAEQSAAFAASLLSGGASPEQAATAAKNIMLALTKGGAASSSERAALEALGFHDPKRLAQAMQAAPEEAMMMVFQRIGNLAEDEQVSVMGQLFGSSAVGAVAPMVGNLDALANAFGLVRDESEYIDSLQKEFESMSATTTAQMNKARESIKVITTAIGSTLLPTVNNFLKVFSKVGLWLGKFANSAPVLVGIVTHVGGALIAAKVAAVGFGYAFTFLKGGFLAIRGAFLSARAAMLLFNGAMKAGVIAAKAQAAWTKIVTAVQWAFNAALWANPLTWVVIGIAAVIAAALLLWKYWDEVTAFFLKAWEWIKEAFANFDPLGWISEKLNALWEWLNGFSLFQSGVELLKTLTDGIVSMAKAPVEAVKKVLGKVRDFLPFSDAKMGPLSELTYSGSQIMETLSSGIMEAANAPLDAMGSALRIAPESLVTGGASAAGGGGMTITINQEIHVAGGGDAYAQARAGASEGAQDLIEQLQRALAREERLSYG